MSLMEQPEQRLLGAALSFSISSDARPEPRAPRTRSAHPQLVVAVLYAAESNRTQRRETQPGWRVGWRLVGGLGAMREKIRQSATRLRNVPHPRQRLRARQPKRLRQDAVAWASTERCVGGGLTGSAPGSRSSR